MKRSTSFFIGFIAAAITAGSLYAFAGPRPFGNQANSYWRYEACRNGDSIGNNNHRQRNDERAAPQATQGDSTANY